MFFWWKGVKLCVTLRKTYIENALGEGAEECSDAGGRK
jgi:hypothetical protein